MKAWNKFCCALASMALLMGSLAAPAFAYGTEQIHDTCGNRMVLPGIQLEFFVRKKRGQVFERNPVPDVCRIAPVYLVHPYEREILLSFFRGTYRSFDRVACLQAEEPDLRLGNVNIVG